MVSRPDLSTPKVSIVVSDLSGGGAIRAFLLGQVLKNLQYNVEICGFLFGQQLYAQPPANLKVVSIEGKKYPGFVGASQRLLRKIDGDIVYVVKPKVSSFGVALLRRLQTHRPLILDMDDWELSWHGGEQWQYRPTLKQLFRDIAKPQGALRDPDHPLYLQWIERLVLHADALTIDTHFLQNRFGGVYLPNGKDTALFDPNLYDPEASRAEYGLSGYRVLMFPGAPRPHKGLEDVLVALEHLNQPDLRVVIVGGSPYDNYDDQLIQRWGRWIVKLPRCAVEEMPKVLASAHVVVVPQRNNLTAMAQFPLKLTDGMAMAKPVLSSRVGDIPNILADTGYLVDPGCPEQIADKVQEIFENFEEASWKGLKARERCVELYSVDAMSVILSKVIDGLGIMN